LNDGLGIIVELKVVAPDQECIYGVLPPDGVAVNIIQVFAQVVGEDGEIVAVGLVYTVTTALPVRSEAWDVQFTSLNAVTVYVVVVVGLTTKVYGLVVIPVTLVVALPSYHDRAQGCVPVKATLIVVEPPLQMVAVPLTTLVGRACTISVVVSEFPLPIIHRYCFPFNVSLAGVIVKVEDNTLL